MTSLKSGGIDLNQQTPEQVMRSSGLALERSNCYRSYCYRSYCRWFVTLSSLTPAFVQIIRSQEILAESRSRPAEAQVEVKNLQAELLSTLRTLQEEQQQQQDSEKALDDDKVPKATCQCTSFVEFFF